jgi:hypothetical protein
VPAAGVSAVQIAVVGMPGDPSISYGVNGVQDTTLGGNGSILTANVPVPAGTTVEEGTLPGGTGGTSDAAEGYYNSDGEWPSPPGPGGNGGGADFLEVTGACPQLLAITGAGGGGAALYNSASGGNGDLGAGATAGGNGGSNHAVDGSGGGAGSSSSGGSGGGGGYDHFSVCDNGNSGQGGDLASGGNGGNGSGSSVTPSGVVNCDGGGGGGGGGAGYYFGGGGGSGFDDDPSGGGGGGSTYLAPGSTLVSDVSYPAADLGGNNPWIVPFYQTTTALSASTNPVSAGQDVTLTATVNQTGGTGASDGSVTFYDGTTNLGQVDVSGGTATLTLDNLPSGTQQLTASYSGGNTQPSYDGNYLLGDFDDPSATVDPYPLTIVPLTTAQILSQPTAIESLPGDTATFTALSYANPAPTAQWQVSTDGGNTWSDIAGATDATSQYASTPLSTATSSTYNFAITGSTLGTSSGQYRAVFTNSQGSTNTLVAPLSFYAASSVGVSPSGENLSPGQTQQMSAMAYYPDGETRDVTNSATWSSTDSGVVSVNATGLATAISSTGDSSATINAAVIYPDGDTIGSNPGAQITVDLYNPTSIVVSPSDPTVPAGGQEQMTATGYFPNGTSANVTNVVNWSSSDPSVVSSEGDGLFQVSTTAGSDTATISASETNGVYGQGSLTTTAGLPASISLSSSLPEGGDTIDLGHTTQLTATATYADGSTANVTSQMSWASNSPSVATVSSTGMVTGTSTAQDDLTATISGRLGSNFGEVQASPITFVVSLDNPSSISITPNPVTLSRGGSESFTATGSYPDNFTANITSLAYWYSSNAYAVGVQSDGQATASSTSGGSNATVAAELGSQIGSATVNVAIGDATSIAITVPSDSIDLGQTEQLTATAQYEGGSTASVTDSVAWSSNDSSLASISSTGLVTGLQPFGTGDGITFYATLSYPSPDTTQVSTDTYGVPFSVTDNDPLSIAVSPATSTEFPGTGGQSFTAIGTYRGGLTASITNQVTWSSNSGLLIWDGGSTFVNEVSGVGGSAAVTATMPTNSVSGSASVTLLSVVAVAGPSSQNVSTGPGFVSTPFTATGGSGTYDWTVQGPSGYSLSVSPNGDSASIVGSPTVDQSGQLNFAVGVADANDPGDLAYYYFTLNVDVSQQTINFTTVPSTAVAGTSVALSATGGGSGNPITYTTEADPGDACYVVGTQLYFYSGPAHCSVSADQAGSNYYAAAQPAYQSILVQAQQVVAFQTTPPSGVAVGSQPYLVSAQTTDYGGGAVSLSIDSTTTNDACSLTSPPSEPAAGQVQFDNAGTCVIDANEAGTTYDAAAPQIQQTITVGQLPQSMTLTSFPPSSAIVGDSYTPAVTLGASGDPVVISIDSSTTNNACTVSGATVSANHAGECVIDFNEPESSTSNYAPAPQLQQSFAVGQAAQAIIITTPGTAQVGTSEAPTATGGASSEPVTFSVDPSTTNDSCSYSGGTLSFVATGSCVLDANQGGNADYSPAPGVSLDIPVVQLQLAVTSAPFTATASADPTTPFVIETVTPSGQPFTGSSATPIVLSSTSNGATFSASIGGAATATLTIPAGQSSVTGYYADSTAGAPTLTASPVTGDVFVPASQVETVEAASVTQLAYSSQPVDEVTGTSQSPSIEVTATDAFGNPVPDASVVLTVSSSSTQFTATTDGSGVATFASLSISTPGAYTLAATSGTGTATSSTFNIYAPIKVTAVSPSTATSAGGTVVTLGGRGFDGARYVQFGNVATTDFTVLSDTSMTVVSPPNPSGGTVKVTVGNDAESSPATNAADYHFIRFVSSTTSLKVSSASSSVGGPVTLSAKVVVPGGSGVPTGAVSFYQGSTLLGTGSLATNGEATLSTSALPIGTSSLTADYSGDDVFGPSTSGAVTHFVGAAVSVSIYSSVPNAYTGEQIVFSATVTGAPDVFGTPTGTVTFKDGSKSVGTVALTGGGDAGLATSLPTGMASVTAVYNGNADYSSGSSARLVEPVYGPVTLALRTAKSCASGSPCTITTTATAVAPTAAGTPRGTVTLYDFATLLGTMTLKNGRASLTTSSLPVGPNGFAASYNGAGAYDPAETTESFNNLDPVALSVDASPRTATPDDTVTFTATLTPTTVAQPQPGGTVTFRDGSSVIGTASVLNTGQAILREPATALAFGKDPVTAVYNGMAQYYKGAASPRIFENVVAPSPVTITSYGPNQITEGQTVDVYATVGGEALATPRTGVVTLYSGAKAVASQALASSGLVSFAVSNLPAGTDSLTVKYSGSFPYQSATSPAVQETVNAVPTVTISSSANPAAPGAQVTFTARLSHAKPLPSPYSGTVTFWENGQSLGTETVSSSGIATLTTSFSSNGMDYVFASYSGNDVYLGTSSSELIETISGVSSVSLTSSDLHDTTGATVTLTATVTGEPTSLGTPTGTVDFDQAGQILGISGLDQNGMAAAQVAGESFEPGKGAVTAVYFGDGNFAGSTSPPVREDVTLPTRTNLIPSVTSVGSGSDITFTAVTYGYQGAFPVGPTGTVTFYEGTGQTKTTIGTATVDTKGEASLTLASTALLPGLDKIAARYGGDDAYEGSISSAAYVQVFGGPDQ